MSDCRIQLHCPPEFESKTWPKYFGKSLLPRVGEIVRSQEGVMLYVVSIVHSEEAPNSSSIPLRHLVEIFLDTGKPS